MQTINVFISVFSLNFIIKEFFKVISSNSGSFLALMLHEWYLTLFFLRERKVKSKNL